MCLRVLDAGLARCASLDGRGRAPPATCRRTMRRRVALHRPVLRDQEPRLLRPAPRRRRPRRRRARSAANRELAAPAVVARAARRARQLTGASSRATSAAPTPASTSGCSAALRGEPTRAARSRRADRGAFRPYARARRPPAAASRRRRLGAAARRRSPRPVTRCMRSGSARRERALPDRLRGGRLGPPRPARPALAAGDLRRRAARARSRRPPALRAALDRIREGGPVEVEALDARARLPRERLLDADADEVAALLAGAGIGRATRRGSPCGCSSPTASPPTTRGRAGGARRARRRPLRRRASTPSCSAGRRSATGADGALSDLRTGDGAARAGRAGRARRRGARARRRRRVRRPRSRRSRSSAPSAELRAAWLEADDAAFARARPRRAARRRRRGGRRARRLATDSPDRAGRRARAPPRRRGARARRRAAAARGRAHAGAAARRSSAASRALPAPAFVARPTARCWAACRSPTGGAVQGRDGGGGGDATVLMTLADSPEAAARGLGPDAVRHALRRSPRFVLAAAGAAGPPAARPLASSRRADRSRLPRALSLCRRRDRADRRGGRARAGGDRGGHRRHELVGAARPRRPGRQARPAPAARQRPPRLGRGPRRRVGAVLLVHAPLQRARAHRAQGGLRRARAGPDRVLRLPRRGLRHRAGQAHGGPLARRHADRRPAAHDVRAVRRARRPPARRPRDGRAARRRALRRCATPTASCGRAATSSPPTSASTAPARSPRR